MVILVGVKYFASYACWATVPRLNVLALPMKVFEMQMPCACSRYVLANKLTRRPHCDSTAFLQ